jgi:hypothetical protein
MDDMKTASRAEFERMADMLLDLAAAEYLASRELSPKLVVMGADPGALVQPGYRFGLVPVAELLTASAGVPGEIVLAALIEKLVRDPEVLVVGHMAEAWRAQYTPEERQRLGNQLSPEDSPNRVEVLLMNLRSADSVALKTLPLLREGLKTTLGPGDLMFKPRARNPVHPRYTH